MTFIPGNKTIAMVSVLCCMTAGLLFGALLAKRRGTVTLYEKKLETTIAALAERNLRESSQE